MRKRSTTTRYVECNWEIPLNMDKLAALPVGQLGDDANGGGVMMRAQAWRHAVSSISTISKRKGKKSGQKKGSVHIARRARWLTKLGQSVTHADAERLTRCLNQDRDGDKHQDLYQKALPSRFYKAK